MFSRFRCAAGQHPGKERLASLYWAWFRTDRVRVAYKQRLCSDHARERLQGLLSHITDDSPDLILCPACGTDASTDLDPIFLTLYMPRAESRAFDLSTCSACAAKIRITALEGAERLEDRANGTAAAVEAVNDAWDWAING
jgi:hypothetical protein